MGEVFVFVPSARVDVVRRRIDAECELHELLVDLMVVDRVRQICELRTKGDGFETRGEFANGARVIIFLDVSARARDGDAVEQLEEVKVEFAQQRVRRAFPGLLFAPCVECALRLPKDVLDAPRCVEALVEVGRVPLVGEGELVLQVGKAVVDRRRREHEHLRPNTRADDALHEPLIAVLLCAAVRSDAVAEVMRLVDHDEVVVAPVQAIQIEPVRLSVAA